MTAQATGSLLPEWGLWIEFLAPEFSYCGHLEIGTFSLCQYSKLKEEKWEECKMYYFKVLFYTSNDLCMFTG